MVVGGVKDFRDNLRHGVLLHRAHIVALVKQRHIERRGFRRPQAQNGNALAVFARDIHIIRHRLNGLVVDKFDVVELIVPGIVNFALKADFQRAFFVRHKPHVAAGQPEIGQLRLPAVDQFLFENTRFVKNRIAARGVALRCKAVKVAGGKSAQSPVAETRVGFARIKAFELHAVIREHAFKNVGQIEIVKVVF